MARHSEGSHLVQLSLFTYFRDHKQLKAFAFGWQITNVTMTTQWVSDRNPANYKGWIFKYLGQQSEGKWNAEKPSSYIHNKNQSS